MWLPKAFDWRQAVTIVKLVPLIRGVFIVRTYSLRHLL